MKQLLRISFSLAIIALLIFSSVGSAFAAPPLQEGGNQQQGQQQGQDQDGDDDENGDVDQDGQQQDQQPGQQQPGVQQPGQQQQQQPGVQQPVQQQQGPQVVNQNVLANACAQTYVVQSGDTLSEIANQTLGSNLAWREIVQATNDVAASANLQRIQNPTFILPGQTLCIPSMQQGQTGQVQQDQQAQQGQMQQDQQGLLPQTGMSAAQAQQLQQLAQQLEQISQQLEQISQQLQQQMGQQSTMAPGQRMTLPEGQGMLIVENLTDRDLIFNLTGESEEGTDTVWLGPGETATFTLPTDTPGQQFSGHEVTGDFGLESGQIDLQPGEIVWLACQENSRCEPVALENVPAHLFERALSGQMQQQPGQMQQQPDQDDQNGDQNGGDNNNNQ